MGGLIPGFGGGTTGQSTDPFGSPTSSPSDTGGMQDWLAGWDPNSYLGGMQQQYGGGQSADGSGPAGGGSQSDGGDGGGGGGGGGQQGGGIVGALTRAINPISQAQAAEAQQPQRQQPAPGQQAAPSWIVQDRFNAAFPAQAASQGGATGSWEPAQPAIDPNSAWGGVRQGWATPQAQAAPPPAPPAPPAQASWGIPANQAVAQLTPPPPQPDPNAPPDPSAPIPGVRPGSILDRMMRGPQAQAAPTQAPTATQTPAQQAQQPPAATDTIDPSQILDPSAGFGGATATGPKVVTTTKEPPLPADTTTPPEEPVSDPTTDRRYTSPAYGGSGGARGDGRMPQNPVQMIGNLLESFLFGGPMGLGSSLGQVAMQILGGGQQGGYGGQQGDQYGNQPSSRDGSPPVAPWLSRGMAAPRNVNPNDYPQSSPEQARRIQEAIRTGQPVPSATISPQNSKNSGNNQPSGALSATPGPITTERPRLTGGTAPGVQPRAVATTPQSAQALSYAPSGNVQSEGNRAIDRAAGPSGGVPRGANFMRGQFGPPGQNLAQVPLSNGRSIQVNRVAAPYFQGFLNDLMAAGAPIRNVGSYNYRTINGGRMLSQHAYGNAIDVDQASRNRVAPAFQRWADDNQPTLRRLQRKWNMRSGGDWRNPDFGHFEWAGPISPATTAANSNNIQRLQAVSQ